MKGTLIALAIVLVLGMADLYGVKIPWGMLAFCLIGAGLRQLWDGAH